MTVDSNDLYAAPGDETEGTVYTAMGGGDWADIAGEQAERGDEVLVINMGPQHPSTHGVLRLMVECDGETVTSIRPGIGFLHTGIEKNMEYRSWTQGTTFVTRMDYVSPLFNEAAYCLAVERLLGIEDKIPQRANDIRVLMMELCRIASHLIAIGTGGMEIGALTVMTIGFREREMILDFFEAVTGLRMNHAYFRPGGVAIDLPETGIAQLRDLINWLEKHLPEYAAFCNENPIFKGRMVGIGHQDLSACFALGVTGPILRSTGYAWDLRKQQPYCGYETYDFDVITWDTSDAYGRFRVRLDEMWESLKIVKQATDRLEASTGQPVMIDDPKIAWPATLAARPRRPGQQPRAHQAHHGRVDGGTDPPLQAGDRRASGSRRARPTCRSRAPRASWPATWSPTAAPSRSGSTCATQGSTTSSPYRSSARAACWPTSSSRSVPSTP